MSQVRYNCIFFFEHRSPAKYRNLLYSDIFKLYRYVERNLGFPVAVNVYFSSTKDFVMQLKSYSSIYKLG